MTWKSKPGASAPDPIVGSVTKFHDAIGLARDCEPHLPHEAARDPNPGVAQTPRALVDLRFERHAMRSHERAGPTPAEAWEAATPSSRGPGFRLRRM